MVQGHDCTRPKISAMLRPLIRLIEKEVRRQPTPRSIHSSLFFPFVFDPLWTMDSPDKVQSHLEHARDIVDEAQKVLASATEFYLGDNFPRPVKKALLESIIRLNFPPHQTPCRPARDRLVWYCRPRETPGQLGGSSPNAL
jgi:hypothetical protein